MRPSEGEAGRYPASVLKLARMANPIATFFRSYPEEAAAAGVDGRWSVVMVKVRVAWMRRFAARKGGVAAGVWGWGWRM